VLLNKEADRKNPLAFTHWYLFRWSLYEEWSSKQQKNR